MNDQNGNVRTSKAPVFVVGCPRSGTTLLYHMLLSAGDFAVYRAESQVFNLLLPRFGDLRIRRNRQHLMDQWLQTAMFTLSGLDPVRTKAKVLDECRNYGDFLRIYMAKSKHCKMLSGGRIVGLSICCSCAKSRRACQTLWLSIRFEMVAMWRYRWTSRDGSGHFHGTESEGCWRLHSIGDGSS